MDDVVSTFNSTLAAGEPTEFFCLIESGAADLYETDSGQPSKLGTADFFGEDMMLATSESRRAGRASTVVVRSEMQCVVVSKESFRHHMGRGSHSSTFRLIIRAFCAIRWVVHGVVVTNTAQVELRSGRVLAPAHGRVAKRDDEPAVVDRSCGGGRGLHWFTFSST